jgi:DNA-binding transcriptional MocR family regulator
MVAAIAREMPGRVSWLAPRGGFFLWVALKDGLTSADVMPLAQSRGVIFVEGRAVFCRWVRCGVHAAVVFGTESFEDR